jgi:uncharacterized protein YecT (DUF1311 family)
MLAIMKPQTTPMRHLVIVTLFFAASLPLFSQDSEQFKACNAKAQTQTDMNACAGAEANRIDAKLNALYRQLLSKAAGEQNAVAKIKASERAWIAYRDAYIDATYPATDKQSGYGSMYGMDVALLRAKLTQQHLAEMQELLKQYSGDSGAGPANPQK